MNEELAVAVIGGLFAVNAALIAAGGAVVSRAIGRVRGEVRAVKHEVTPNHGHSAHDSLAGQIEGVRLEVRHVSEDVQQSREDTRQLRGEVRQIRDDTQTGLRDHIADHHTK